jgi:uncharacterized membrane protein YphA (DoxX/SURF4 family)
MNPHPDASGRLSVANKIAPLLLRLALGVTLLSALADRFGISGPPGAATVAWGDWTHFVAYTAKVNSFLPSVLAPALAIVATAAEALLGITLILGIFRRPVAFASAALFALVADEHKKWPSFQKSSASVIIRGSDSTAAEENEQQPEKSRYRSLAV